MSPMQCWTVLTASCFRERQPRVMNIVLHLCLYSGAWAIGRWIEVVCADQTCGIVTIISGLHQYAVDLHIPRLLADRPIFFLIGSGCIVADVANSECIHNPYNCLHSDTSYVLYTLIPAGVRNMYLRYGSLL